MTINEILPLITYLIALLLGYIAKKCNFISDNLIPIQNILVGLVIAIIDYAFTKDFNIAIATSGLIAGGSYDIVHNLEKMKR